jgi:hypothetical protein
MRTEVAIRRGVGTVVLNVRHGDGSQSCFNYTEWDQEFESVFLQRRVACELPTGSLVRNANVNWLIATTMLITREQTRVVAKRTPPVLAFPAGILIIPARASLGTNQQSRL